MFTSLPTAMRKLGALRGSVITIEGLIGIGKTTLGEAFVQYLNKQGFQARFFPEYVNPYFLGKYIANMSRYSFSFQLFMLEKRLQIYKEAQAFANTGGIALIDRSLNGDYTFAWMQWRKGFFTEEEWEIYRALLTKEPISEPHLTLYLTCDPETSLCRIARRGNEDEIKGYQLAYMKELDQAYQVHMREIVKHPVLKLDWNENKELTETVLFGLAQQIVDSLQSS